VSAYIQDIGLQQVSSEQGHGTWSCDDGEFEAARRDGEGPSEIRDMDPSVGNSCVRFNQVVQIAFVDMSIYGHLKLG
jgi:hypothetical protein